MYGDDMEMIKWILLALMSFAGSALIQLVYYLIAKSPKNTHSKASIVRTVMFVFYYPLLLVLAIYFDLSDSALFLGAYAGFMLSRIYFTRKLVEISPEDKMILVPHEDKNNQ